MSTSRRGWRIAFWDRYDRLFDSWLDKLRARSTPLWQILYGALQVTLVLGPIVLVIYVIRR